MARDGLISDSKNRPGLHKTNASGEYRLDCRCRWLVNMLQQRTTTSKITLPPHDLAESITH